MQRLWSIPASECYPEKDGAGALSRHTPGALVSTAYLYLDTVQMKEIAEILGKHEDAEYYAELGRKVRNAYNRVFFNKERNWYHTGSQGSNAISANLGLTPDECIEGVIRNIETDIASRGDHLSTGNQGTKHMMEALSRYGKVDIAYRVMTQTTYPGFGYMVGKGATTIWERWEADNSNNVMNSRDHPMHGSVCTWSYKCIAGLRPAADAVGFDKMVIAPQIPQKLTYAEITLGTVLGRVRIRWEKTGEGLELSASLPFNASAEIIIPVLPEMVDHVEKPILIESGRVIFDGEGTVGECEGITSVVLIPGGIQLKAGAGSFHFLVQ